METVRPSSGRSRLLNDQAYDESLEVPDAEEVASQYTPTPGRGGNMADRASDSIDDDDHQLQGGDSGPKRTGADRLAQESEEEEDEEDDEDEDSEGAGGGEGGPPEGCYDPSEYDTLPVSQDIKELFQYISRYTPTSVEMMYQLKPFIPDFMPAVGDLDAFIKVSRPDGKPDTIGLTVLDEPSSAQSDPQILELMLRNQSKMSTTTDVAIKSIEGADKNPKLIDKWIKNVENLHKMKAAPSVNTNASLPDIEELMQEWPPHYEELLKTVDLPTADLDCTLEEYADIVCAVLDIKRTVNKTTKQPSRVQALHTLFTLYSEFKNSHHFKSLADDNRLDNELKKGAAGDSADRLEL